MNELLFAESFGKGADDYYEFERRIDAVTLETVKKLADIKKYSTAAVVPK
jgi:predicted Zn-dependent peptidase